MGKPGRGTKHGKVEEARGFDLTPMIDVTFLLIVFFLLVTELSDLTKAKLELPRVVMGDPDTRGDPTRVVVNVLQSGDIEVMGRAYTDRELDRLLALKARIDPDRMVLIRADGRVAYSRVQQVLQSSMAHGLWRVAFGAQDPRVSGD